MYKRQVEKVIKVLNPYLMTGSAHKGGGFRVFKVNARYLESGEVRSLHADYRTVFVDGYSVKATKNLKASPFRAGMANSY